MQTSYVYSMRIDIYAFISKLRWFWFITLTSPLWTCALRDRLSSPASQSQKDARTSVFPLPFIDDMLMKKTCLFPPPEKVEMNWTQHCPAICFSSFVMCVSSAALLAPWLILALEPWVLHGDDTSIRPPWFQKPSPQTGIAGSPEHFQLIFVACLEVEEFLIHCNSTSPNGKFSIKFIGTKELPEGSTVVLLT